MIAMPLNHDVHELLLILERAQGGNQEWVHIDALRHLSEKEIERAVRENWVKQKSFGNNREFKILAAGYSALGDNAELSIRQMRGDNVAPPDNQPAPDSPRSSIRSLIQPLGAAKPVGTRHISSDRTRSNGVKTCCEPGCDQPCYRTATKRFTRCEEHQKAYWRNKQAEQRDVVSPNRQRRSSPPTQPSASYITIDEPPFADEDTQPDIIPVTVLSPVDTPPVLTRLLIRAAVRFILIAKGG
jgi:hypothetical protein